MGARAVGCNTWGVPWGCTPSGRELWGCTAPGASSPEGAPRLARKLWGRTLDPHLVRSLGLAARAGLVS